VSETDRHRYVRFDGAKSNVSLAGGGAKPRWLYRASVTLENGEEVGALEPVVLEKRKAPETDWWETMADAMHTAGMDDGHPREAKDVWALEGMRRRTGDAHRQWLKGEAPVAGEKYEFNVQEGKLLVTMTRGTSQNTIAFVPLRSSVQPEHDATEATENVAETDV
jgi:hypothetical protein